MLTRFSCLSLLLLPFMLAAVDPHFAWQPDDPASWALKQKPPTGKSEQESRWSAEGIQRSIDENHRQQENNDAYQKQQKQAQASRNPLCSEKNRQQIYRNDNRRDVSRNRQTFSQVCPDNGVKFTQGD